MDQTLTGEERNHASPYRRMVRLMRDKNVIKKHTSMDKIMAETWMYSTVYMHIHVHVDTVIIMYKWKAYMYMYIVG